MWYSLIEASPHRQKPTINITFIDRDGESIQVAAPVGENLLEVAHANDVDLEVRRHGRVYNSLVLRAHAKVRWPAARVT